MKLRIRGNSIRLRLGESEVARLAAEGKVEESTQFAAAPGHQLTFTVSASPSAPQISAAIHEQTISIDIPEVVCRKWVGSNEVSLKANQPIGDGRSLTILVEKDFKCLEPRHDEDESDAFPNPAGRVCNPD
jgi:hypothetical protein